ncbi:hypothetical protein ACFVIM_03770 [Streptomyces sp. NPDC057638]|uniref:hypothetical protein n=1 Tax=Streptomyces sp. NPDC057638 TaxID=3346190 RepID=UPI003692D3D7
MKDDSSVPGPLPRRGRIAPPGPPRRLPLAARALAAAVTAAALLPLTAAVPAAAVPSPTPTTKATTKATTAATTAPPTAGADDRLADDGLADEPAGEQNDRVGNDGPPAARGTSAPRTATAAGRPQDFRIAPTGDLGGLVTRLGTSLPQQTLTKLLEQTDRTARLGGACGPEAHFGASLRPERRACWEPADAVSKEWIPQGISGISDAQEDERWGASPADPVAISSYDADNPGRGNRVNERDYCLQPGVDEACNEKGVRVTFLNQLTGAYRHVLLVWPYLNPQRNVSFDAIHAREGTCPEFGPLAPDCMAQEGIHAGGIVWYGDHLYVADTANGLRVFDLGTILDLDADQNPAVHDRTPDGLTSNVQDQVRVGRHNNVWYSYGYRYVMPQVATLTFTTPRHGGATDENQCYPTGRPKASYASLDRTGTKHLIIGEYCNLNSEGAQSPGRVAALPMPALAAAVRGTEGAIDATEAYELPRGAVLGTGTEPLWHKIQGVERYEGRWYFHRSNGGSPGKLLRATTAAGAFTPHPVVLDSVIGPEDLYLTHGRGRNLPPALWSLSEHAPSASCATCAREVFSYPLSQVDGGFTP